MTESELKERLKEISYPGFTRDIVSFGLVKEISLDAQRCEVRLNIVTEKDEVVAQIVAEVETLLASIDGLPQSDVVVERGKPAGGPAQARQAADATGRGPKGMPGVQRILAVASGKGGVGKSTVAAGLACALAAAGHRVGLLDADIYGPSVPRLFGIPDDQRGGSDEEGRFVPFERFGVRLVSMGFFVGQGVPLIWRGPMLGKALGQFLGDCAWGELDYLVLDLPPGTGDVQMNLTQTLKIDGGIIVTTPQDVALADVERGIKMFQEAATPVVGIIENMSFHECPSCNHRSTVFGDGGGLRVSQQFSVPLLGGIPLQRSIRESSDAGVPPVVSHPDGPVGAAFTELAREIAGKVPAGRQLDA